MKKKRICAMDGGNLKDVFVKLHRLDLKSLKKLGWKNEKTGSVKGLELRPCSTAVSDAESGAERVECVTCGRILYTEQMYRHLRRHISMDSFTFTHCCCTCSTYFSNLTHLNEHLKTHLKDQSLKAKHISLEEDPPPVQVHSGTTESTNNDSDSRTAAFGSCHHCKRSFSHRQSLHRHMLTHETFKKNIQGRVQKKKKRRKSKRRFPKSTFRCAKCNKYFTRQDSLKIHSLKCVPGLTFACQECNIKFLLKWQLTRHNMTEHGEETNFRCSWCSQYFTKGLYLKKHVKGHMKSLEDFTASEVTRMSSCCVLLDPIIESPSNPVPMELISSNSRNINQKIKKKVRFCIDKKVLKPRAKKRHGRKKFWSRRKKLSSKSMGLRKILDQNSEDLTVNEVQNRQEGKISDDNLSSKCKKCMKKFEVQESLLSHYIFAHAGVERRPLKILN